MDASPPPWLSAASRTAVLDARLDAAELRERLFGDPTTDVVDEVTWLRRVVAAQETELARLREGLRVLRVQSRSTSVERLVAAVAAALTAGEAALGDRVIAHAHAELRVALAVFEGETGVVVGGLRDPPGEASGTIAFDVRRVPPSPAQETALGELVAAALELQAALDQPFPPQAAEAAGRALAAASELAAARPDDAPSLVRPLADAVTALAGRLDGLAEQAAGLAQAASAPPGPEALAEAAAAIREVAGTMQ
jgi:hypothetical protein